MLWIKLKVGESVNIDGSKLVLLTKDKHGVVVLWNDESHFIQRNSSKNFSNFRLCLKTSPKGFRIGFDAPQDVSIRRL